MLITVDRVHTEAKLSLLNIGPKRIIIGQSEAGDETPIFTDLSSSVDQLTLS